MVTSYRIFTSACLLACVFVRFAEGTLGSLGHAACYIQQHSLRDVALRVQEQLQRAEASDEHQSYSLYKRARASIRDELEQQIFDLQKRNCTAIRLSDAASLQHNSSRLQDSHSRTTMLLVSDSWERVGMYLRNYSINVLTYWHYANHWGYGLELYVHDSPMPPYMTGHFAKLPGIKAMFQLGYDYVLGLDWDMYINPNTAVPLSSFFNEWPSASLLIQGETNMCTAALLYRNTPAGNKWLDHWWNLGVEGCCRTFTHDQLAFKHMINEYMRNFTGKSELYSDETWQLMQRLKAGILPSLEVPAGKVTPGLGPGHEPHFIIEPPQQDVNTWIQLKDTLQQGGSDFGFAGLGAHKFNDSSLVHQPGDHSSVALHNCHGIWWGCVPKNAPALLMHYSHRRTPDTNGFHWIAKRVLNTVRAWGSQQVPYWSTPDQTCSNESERVPTAGSAAAAAAAAVTVETSEVLARLV